MDAGAGQYDSGKHSSVKNRGTSTNRPSTVGSMVEIFLKESGDAIGGGIGKLNSTAGRKGGSSWWWSSSSSSSTTSNPRPAQYHSTRTCWETCQDTAARVVVPLACLACLAVIVLIVVLTQSGSDGTAVAVPEPKETTTVNDIDGMTSAMASMSKLLIAKKAMHANALKDPASPAVQALTWVSQDGIALASLEDSQQRRLIEQEELEMMQAMEELEGLTVYHRELAALDHHRIVQRYALAFLYYTWGAKQLDSGATLDALVSAELSLNLAPGAGDKNGIENSIQGTPWLSEVSECDWTGIDCHDESKTLASFGEVTGAASSHSQIRVLNLTAHELTGPLPLLELTALSNLVILDLRDNQLTGELLSKEEEKNNVLSNWKLLEYLLLGKNELTGELPESITDMDRIRDIDISHNKLSGPLPKWTDGQSPMEEMDNLYLEHNAFTGQIPASFLRDLPHLGYIDLSYNKLEGKLPEELAELTSLKYWHSNHNSLTGKLPTAYSSMTRLRKSRRSMVGALLFVLLSWTFCLTHFCTYL